MKFLTFLTVLCGFLILQDVTASQDAISQGKINRIVVLSPALAQTMIDIGLEDKLVCAAGPLDSVKFSKKIELVGMYHKPVIELIIKCKPDLIITTYAGTPPEVYAKLKKLGYNLILEKPESVQSIKKFIVDLSKKFKMPVPKITREFDNACVKKSQKSVVILPGINPVIAAGKKSFVSNAFDCAGFKNVIDGTYPRVSIEKIIDLNPELLFVAVKNPENISDYKILSKVFKDRLIIVNPDNILEPSTKILKGIKELRLLNK